MGILHKMNDVVDFQNGQWVQLYQVMEEPATFRSCGGDKIGKGSIRLLTGLCFVIGFTVYLYIDVHSFFFM